MRKSFDVGRRDFLKTLSLGLAAGSWPSLARATGISGASPSTPNVLFMIVDDLNDWVLHPEGHPKVHTPNIDRLRRRSLSFTNAHVAVPSCAPSRICLFTGLSPQTADHWGFTHWKDLPRFQNCVPMPLHFRNHGYATYGTGKLLHEGAGGDFYTQFEGIPDYGPWPWTGKGPVVNTPLPRQYEQWKDVLPVKMHRDTNYGPLSEVPKWEPGAMDDIPGATGWYYEDGKPFHYEDESHRSPMPDEQYADWAAKVISEQNDRPWFLGVGFVRPHTPMYAPDSYFDMYPLDKIDLPPYLKDDRADCAPVLRDRWQWGYQKFEALIKAGGLRAWKEWVQAYLACTTFVDDQIGKVLDALDQSPQRDNTIVILVGDNGYHVGEKDCVQKWHLWEESTRVPLLFYVPGAPGNGRTCDHPVSLIDLYPTLIDLCGLLDEPHRTHHHYRLEGHSLRPFLDNPDATQWDGPSVALTAIGNPNIPSLMPVAEGDGDIHFSVRSRRHRYTLCGNGQEELYDHYLDPNEWTNLAHDPLHTPVKAALRKELFDILKVTTTPPGYKP